MTFLIFIQISWSRDLIYSFGIAPQQSATALIEAWSPLIEKMKSDCHCKITFLTAPSIAEFEININKGIYDLVYLNPLHFINSQKIGYTSLVREEGRKLKGIIIVRKDSPIKNLEDLKGQKIAFPGETAFAATVLVKKKLELKKINFEPVYVKSHDSVFQNVLTGLMPAGGAVNRTLEGLAETDKEKLRTLDTTDSVTPHPIAIKKSIDKKKKAIFLKTLIGLNSSEEGMKILEKLELKPLVEAKDSDWDDVKQLIGDL